MPVAKVGMPGDNMTITAGGGMLGFDGFSELFEGTPYTSVPHREKSRWAKAGDIVELTVTNGTLAHHPFHLHGFSFQPVSLTPTMGGAEVMWPFTEFRDNLDIPAGHALKFKVHLSDRFLADTINGGGALGRWFFHCHIFFHAHHGMISELVVTDPDGSGREKPNINVHGSFAYAMSGGVATRTGKYSHPDADLFAGVALSASMGTVNILPGGNWSWSVNTAADGIMNGIHYVYVTATDAAGRKDQAVFRLQVGGVDQGTDNGDPHIKTIDGTKYDFQAAGEFVLLRDYEGMEVQTRQTPVLTANPITDPYTGLKSCVSLNTAMAAKVGKHRIAYQPGREPGQLQFYLDGKPASLGKRYNLDGHLVSGFPVEGGTALRIDYAHHVVVIVTPHFWNSHKLWYMNISISHAHNAEGLMGPIPKGSWLPMLPNGASVGPKPAGLNDLYMTLYKTFANAWRVTNKTSLFVYAPGTSTATFTDKDWPAGEPPCNLKPQFEIPGVAVPLGMPIDQAKQICQIITEPGLNQDCVFDVATTGDADFAKGYRLAQEIRERSTVVQIVSVKPGHVIAVVGRLAGTKPLPKGKIRFYADGKETGTPMQPDANGQVHWKISGLDKGDHALSAAFVPDDGSPAYPSNSPDLNISLPESTSGNAGGGNTGDGLFKRWYVWLILLLIALLLTWLLVKGC